MLKCEIDNEGLCTWDAEGSTIALAENVLHLIGSVFCALKQASEPDANLFRRVIEVGVANNISVFDSSGYAQFSATVCNDPRK